MTAANAVAVVFREMWDDRPRPSTWVVGRGRATLVHKDDFGKLWGLTRLGRRSGARRGGRERDTRARPLAPPLLLARPARVRTAREAVAWTFGFESAREYTVAVES